MDRIQQLVLFVVSMYICMWFLNTDTKYSAEYLRGKRVVITGASSGVGEQLAYHYSRLGARLLLSARRQPNLEKVAEKCRMLGAKTVDVAVGDLTCEKSQHNLTKMSELLFDGQIDQLLLSHGMYEANKWSGSQSDLNRLKTAMNTNFVSYVDVVSKLLPQLNAGAGAVGVVSGLAGLVPAPLLSEFSASQAAQQRFFSALRQELKEAPSSKVSVTTVILGMVTTEKSRPIYEKWFPLLNRWMSTSAEGAAEAIARAVTDGHQQVIYPFRAQLQRIFYDLYQEVYEYNFHFIS